MFVDLVKWLLYSLVVDKIGTSMDCYPAGGVGEVREEISTGATDRSHKSSTLLRPRSSCTESCVQIQCRRAIDLRNTPDTAASTGPRLCGSV